MNIAGAGAATPQGAAIDDILAKLYTPVINGDTPLISGGAEDCLFLDIYVPGKAVRNPTRYKLPVIHWFYGGGYLFGSKDQLQPFLPWYDGSGLIGQSGNNVIFVASNYRLGAIGFLAGSTMEKTGTPNAGLWDQRMALQWTKDNIGLLGGDPSQITAMGESAGASSLLHHLVFNGGTTDPLFTKAVLQSPAFLPMVDRQGSLEAVYQNFSTLAGCAGGDMNCLRAASSDTIIKANRVLNSKAIAGTFIVGPSADGSLIRQTPSLEYASGNYWKNLQSIMVTHTSDESTIFVDGSIKTDDQATKYIKALFPKYAVDVGLDKILIDKYPGVDTQNSPYKNENQRINALTRDSAFTCNVRFLAQAYQGKAYLGRYSITPGWHATDLIPLFWTNGFQNSPLGNALAIAFPLITSFSEAFKSYYTSFVRTGNPNTYRKILSFPSTIDWPLASGATTSQNMKNVVDITDLGFWTTDDDQIQLDTCRFWQQWESALTIAGGYSPPGVYVDTPFVNSTVKEGASARYNL